MKGRIIITKYYNSNDVYKRISESNNSSDYIYAVGNSWQLVYGDRSANPKICVYVKGVKSTELFEDNSKEDQVFYNILYLLSKKISIPCYIMKFPTDLGGLSNSMVININNKKSTLENWLRIFHDNGIHNPDINSNKPINDKVSSGYHQWQFNNLKGFTVSDLDLVKVDCNNNPLIVWELKRSMYPLERWKPFREDYNNFRLMSNLCYPSNVSFKIAYNHLSGRQGERRIDNASKLKIFDINFLKENEGNHILEKGIINFNQFLNI